MKVDEVVWATGPPDAFQPHSRPQVVRWEEPPASTSRNCGGRPTGGRWAVVADELRGNPGRWAVLYDGSNARHGWLSNAIRTGAMACFRPVGDFDAQTRESDGRRIVYARFLGDGDLP